MDTIPQYVCPRVSQLAQISGLSGQGLRLPSAFLIRQLRVRTSARASVLSSAAWPLAGRFAWPLFFDVQFPRRA